jgi:pimeloyl-ACP methyl ester carboxylesterase
MVTIILPGYSSHNREWVEKTAAEITGDSEIRPIYWGHWTDPTIKFDAKVKSSLLDGISGKRVIDIIAKSIGTLVASYLIEKSPEKIRKVILCGIPLNDIDEDKKEIIKNALKKIPAENIVCFQNDEDPHGGISVVKNFL